LGPRIRACLTHEILADAHQRRGSAARRRQLLLLVAARLARVGLSSRNVSVQPHWLRARFC
jgi:hypothetical protein